METEGSMQTDGSTDEESLLDLSWLLKHVNKQHGNRQTLFSSQPYSEYSKMFQGYSRCTALCRAGGYSGSEELRDLVLFQPISLPVLHFSWSAGLWK